MFIFFIIGNFYFFFDQLIVAALVFVGSLPAVEQCVFCCAVDKLGSHDGTPPTCVSVGDPYAKMWIVENGTRQQFN